MSRSRVVLTAAAAVVGLGILAALGVLALSPARAAVGPLPAEALAFPAEARFLIGVDVKRLVASPLYARFAKGPGAMRPDAFKDLEAKTGIDPERDVKQLLVAGGVGGKNEALALALGDFDTAQIGHAIEARKQAATARKVAGASLYLFDEGKPSASTLALLDPHTIVLGPAALVEATVASHGQGQATLRGNPTLMDLVAAVRPGSTFWMVGDQSLLASMPTSLPGPGSSKGTSSSMTLPALNSVSVTGDLDPVLSIDVIGGATDPAAASKLADMARGIVALATLQAVQRPELKDLGTAFSVTTETNHVKLSAHLSHDLVEALSKPKEAQAPRP